VGEDLVCFEDDVVLCRNAARYAERLIVPDDVAFVSLYAPWGDLTMPPGLWRARCHSFAGAQFLKISHLTCLILVSARGEMEAALDLGGSDDMLKLLGKRRDWLYAAHYPGLAQHVGMVSSLGNGDKTPRVSRAYPGDPFDAGLLDSSIFR
jgi:hypothetical protein